MTDVPRSRRRSFGPVVLLGLVAGIGLAMAGTEPWFAADQGAHVCDAPCIEPSGASGEVPAANALALVALACWGVLLVTRGRVRRVVTALGLLTALGLVIVSVVAFRTAAEDVRAAYEQISVTVPAVSSTGWSWIGAGASVLSLLAWLAAVRFVGDWPEMGRRYDSPSDSPPEDLWKAIDAGHDPTSQPPD